MKLLFSMFVSTAMICSLKAQTKTTNLYELIKSSLPDSSSSVSLTDWKKGISLNSVVKWNDKTPRKEVFKGVGGKKNEVMYSQNGSAKVLLPDKKHDEVGVRLEGKSANGYSVVEIEMSMIEDYNLEKLLGDKKYSMTLIKKEGEHNPFYYYRVKFPGKKDAWVTLMTITYTGALNPEGPEPTLEISVLFDVNEFKSRAL